MATNASNEYLRNAVMTATPEQLQLMLYDGAIRYASQGLEAIQKGKIEDSFNALTRAQRIVMELESGLRPEIAPELCDKMSSLYTFIYQHLVDGCVRRDPKPIEDALKILRHQRETWVLLIEKLVSERGAAAPAETDTPQPVGFAAEG